MSQKQKQLSDDPNEGKPQQFVALVSLKDSQREKPYLSRINADNKSKTFICMFWSIFLVFITLLIVLSKTLPPTIEEFTNKSQLSGSPLSNCQNPILLEGQDFQCKTFPQETTTLSIILRDVSSLNQFAVFWLYLYPKDAETPLVINQNITYLIYGLSRQNKFQKEVLHQNETFTFLQNFESTTELQSDDQISQGYKMFIGFLGQHFIYARQFSTENLWIGLKFGGPITQLANITKFQIHGFRVAKNFIKFTIALRYIFFVLSLLSGFLFIWRYRKIAIQDRIIEQKLIVILSISLVFFNDPFYAITVLKENKFSSFLSTVFVFSFISYLVFMWIVFYDRILHEEGQKQTVQISKYKIFYAIILFILLVVVYLQYAYYKADGRPFIPTQRFKQKSLLALDVFTMIWFCLGTLYIFVEIFRILLRKLDCLWRSTLFMAFSVLFLVALMIFIFIDNAFGSYSYQGTVFVFLYGLMNLYTWYLQYMYRPNQGIYDQLDEIKSFNSDQFISQSASVNNDQTINLDDNICSKQEELGVVYNLQNRNKRIANKHSVNNLPQEPKEQSFQIQDEAQNHFERHQNKNLDFLQQATHQKNNHNHIYLFGQDQNRQPISLQPQSKEKDLLQISSQIKKDSQPAVGQNQSIVPESYLVQLQPNKFQTKPQQRKQERNHEFQLHEEQFEANMTNQKNKNHEKFDNFQLQ